jgi:hypothetical protein
MPRLHHANLRCPIRAALPPEEGGRDWSGRIACNFRVAALFGLPTDSSCPRGELMYEHVANSPAAGQRSPVPDITDTHVVKTLRAGQAGSRQWQERYGKALVCVRYRQDEQNTKRYVTVELVVADRPVRIRTVAVRIELHEKEQRQQARRAGALCDPDGLVWRLPQSQVKALGWTHRRVTR